MVTPRRIKLAVVSIVLAVLWLVMFVEGTDVVDRAVLGAMYTGGRPEIADIARLVTLLGGGYWVTPLIALTALALAVRKRPWVALVLFAGNALGRLLIELQKYQLGRLRPDLNPHLVEVYSMSFPSAHSANAVLTYVAMAALLPEEGRRRVWLILAAALSFLIGLSRILLGVHWPSDVIAGWSFGLLWVMAMVWAVNRPPSRFVTR